LKHKRVIRIFFNTYDEKEALNIKALVSQFGSIQMARSEVAKELYYIELVPREADKLEEIAELLQEKIAGRNSVFGVKVYYVKT